MCVHERLQLVAFFELLRGGKTLLLLLLVKHHLLNNAARVAIEVRQLGVLRLDLLSVDFLVAFKHTIPPVLPVQFREAQLQNTLSVRIALQCPKRVVKLDFLAECLVD